MFGGANVTLKKYVNGQYVELTAEEIEALNLNIDEMSRDYWRGAFETLVEEQIRRRYTLNEELAILRQRDSKPEEFAEYNAYCEECKNYVKIQQIKYSD